MFYDVKVYNNHIYILSANSGFVNTYLESYYMKYCTKSALNMCCNLSHTHNKKSAKNDAKIHNAVFF